MYHTLGCKLNFAETSSIAAQLEARGITTATAGIEPDLIIVNTCSVTAEADKKCRQLLRSLARKHPQASIIVTGCYAQLRPQEASSIPGVAVVAGNDRKDRVPEYVDRWLKERSDDAVTTPEQLIDVTPSQDIRQFTPACSRGQRTRYFLKVQDGCDYWCTYCTIPRARGRSRSATIDAVVEQAAQAAAEGGREIVITGVNIGDFGKGRTDTFFDLMRALDAVEGIERYRISSIEPNLLTDEMIEWVAGSRAFMPHFHIPLQAGTDEVLALMHRHYDTALFRHRVETIKHFMPHAFIGVDLIAGARGETAELFEASRRFVESLDITRLHVFPYSERPDTKALNIGHIVSQSDKHARVSVMMALSDDKQTSFSHRFEHTVRPVLLEHTDSHGSMAGFTDNYLRVRLPSPAPELAGKVVDVELGGYSPESAEFTGKIIIQ